jgi:NTE family protein
MQRIALTLPGGGARAAYQAGVLRAISDICQFRESPFKIISGISAGAINGMWLASQTHDFEQSTAMMWDTWKELRVSDVYKTDAVTLAKTGATWLKNLSLGEWFGNTKGTNYLLDTSPLKQTLKDKINFQNINDNLERGLIYGLSLSATDYSTGAGVTYFTGDKAIQDWKHTLSIGRRDKLTVDHVLASAAIPIFFPPISIGGKDHGDGGIGLKTPLSPAIHMGATKLLVIGVQNPRAVDEPDSDQAPQRATLGDISGTLLNSLFLNSLDLDVDRLQKINHNTSLGKSYTTETGLRNIPLLLIRPSRDLSCVGAKEFSHFPFTIRYLLKGLGVSNEKGWDLLSYLAFDQVYSAALLELGYNDALQIKDKIIDFFKDEAST